MRGERARCRASPVRPPRGSGSGKCRERPRGPVPCELNPRPPRSSPPASTDHRSTRVRRGFGRLRSQFALDGRSSSLPWDPTRTTRRGAAPRAHTGGSQRPRVPRPRPRTGHALRPVRDGIPRVVVGRDSRPRVGHEPTSPRFPVPALLRGRSGALALGLECVRVHGLAPADRANREHGSDRVPGRMGNGALSVYIPLG